jgi:hypothetical protein
MAEIDENKYYDRLNDKMMQDYILKFSSFRIKQLSLFTMLHW